VRKHLYRILDCNYNSYHNVRHIILIIKIFLIIEFFSSNFYPQNSYFRHRFNYWSRRGISGPKFVEWQGFFTKHHDWTVEQIKKYGRVYGAYDFFGRNLIVNEPDLIRDIMVKDFHNFPNRKDMNLGSAKTKLSLFFLPGNEDWKRIRSIVSPTFTSGKLKQMMSSISDISDKFVLNLDKIAEKGMKKTFFVMTNN
jgi:cytochrome P450